MVRRAAAVLAAFNIIVIKNNTKSYYQKIIGEGRKTKYTQGVCSGYQSRNYRLKRNGNSANFFPYVCNDKKTKELFASTLNRIAAGVRYVSSMIAVLNTKLTD